MKELKDYLHLYLGCPMQKKLAGRNEGIATLDFIDESVYMLIENGMLIPILRPLSSMTEGEDTELQIFMKPYLDRLDDDNHAISHGEVDAERTRWALSKHFDLFGLIESGLAIDEIKHNTPNNN